MPGVCNLHCVCARKAVPEKAVNNHPAALASHTFRAHSAMRHPNVTLIMGACATDEQLVLVTELVERGSMWDVLRDGKLRLDWRLRLSIALDAALGMNYLHHKQLMHGDLKTPNLLITTNFHVKVADFRYYHQPCCSLLLLAHTVLTLQT